MIKIFDEAKDAFEIYLSIQNDRLGDAVIHVNITIMNYLFNNSCLRNYEVFLYFQFYIRSLCTVSV